MSLPLQLSPTWLGACLTMPLYCFSIILIFYTEQIDNQSFNQRDIIPIQKYKFHVSISFCLRYMHILLFFSISFDQNKLITFYSVHEIETKHFSLGTYLYVCFLSFDCIRMLLLAFYTIDNVQNKIVRRLEKHLTKKQALHDI